MKKEDIKPGMPVCIQDSKGMPFCNTRVVSRQHPFIGAKMVAVEGVEHPVYIDQLRPATPGYYETNPNGK